MVAKPFAYPELRARIAANPPPLQGALGSRLEAHRPADDRCARWRGNDQPVELSAKEYELLLALSSRRDRLFTREELLRDVWAFEVDAARARST